MARNTSYLGLYCKDPIDDGNDTFNIQTMLNDNWEKIDNILRPLNPKTGLSKYVSGRLEDYIKLSEKGVANGVATLGEDSKVPKSQLPSMDYIPTSAKGAANGVATLGEDSKVPANQLPDMDYVKSSEKGSANGVATLDANSKIPENQIRFRFKVVTYTGTGTYGSSSSNKTKIQFNGFIPRVIFIYGNGDIAIIVNNSISGENIYGMFFSASNISTTYDQNDFSIIRINASVTTAFYPKVTLNFYTNVSDKNQADCQMNKQDVEYTAIAIGEEFIIES